MLPHLPSCLAPLLTKGRMSRHSLPGKTGGTSVLPTFPVARCTCTRQQGRRLTPTSGSARGAMTAKSDDGGKAAAVTPSETKSRTLHHALAATTSGVISCTVFQPLSLIQTRFQVTPKATVQSKTVASTPSYRYRSLFHAFRSVVSEEGVRALYQGLTPAIVGNATAWGLYFAFYTEAKSLWLEHKRSTGQLVEDRYGNLELGVKEHLVCATVGGCMTSLCTNPIWVLKTRMQVQVYGSEASYRNVFHGARQIWATEGIRGFYRGLLPSLLGATHGTVQFGIYEELKKIRRAQTGRKNVSGTEAMVAGALSKVAAGVVTYPYLVVKSRMQIKPAEGKPAPYAGVVDVLKKTWRREGVSGFYRGCLISVMRTTPASALTLSLYEKVLGLLQGGHHH